jgi:hypothetical protein
MRLVVVTVVLTYNPGPMSLDPTFKDKKKITSKTLMLSIRSVCLFILQKSANKQDKIQ